MGACRRLRRVGFAAAVGRDVEAAAQAADSAGRDLEI